MRIRQGVVLIGGLGTRLGALTRDTPKPLIEVGGRPFVEHVIAHLARFGVDDIVLLAGHRGEMVREQYAGRRLFGASISVVVEATPLGTAGALRNAANSLADRFFLCNGDSFFDADLSSLVSDGEATVMLRRVEDGGRFGCVELDADGKIVRFAEKAGGRNVLINSGIYCLERDPVLSAVDLTPASLEKDVFPRLVARRMLRGLPAEGYFVDMGIPADLDAARREINARRTRPAAFLDRDGVLNKDNGYTHRPDDLVWIDGAPEAIRILNEAGYYVIVVTNQAGVARGYYDEDAVRAFHSRMQDLLVAAGAHIDAFYHCPHHPEGTRKAFSIDCRCRKPGPGLLEQAAQDWPIDAGRSFLIGDKDSDIAAAASFGVRGAKFDQSTMSLSALVTREILASGGSFA